MPGNFINRHPQIEVKMLMNFSFFAPRINILLEACSRCLFSCTLRDFAGGTKSQPYFWTGERGGRRVVQTFSQGRINGTNGREGIAIRKTRSQRD